MKKKRQTKKTQLELQYKQFFTPMVETPALTNGSLRQPSPLKSVPSIATSGAYEEPLRFDFKVKHHA